MRLYLLAIITVFFHLSCDQNGSKLKKTNPQKKEKVETSAISDTSMATPKKEDIQLSKAPDQDILTNTLQTDAKKYAQLLCSVEKNEETVEITNELQRIVNRYSNDPDKSEEFGKAVEREFKNCK